MAFRLEFAADAEHDFGLIFDHLLQSYLDFGESPESAFDHAESRTTGIRGTAERILTAPHRDARHDDVLPGLRHLAVGRAICWFDVDGSRAVVRVLAAFFGGRITSATCWRGSWTRNAKRQYRNVYGPVQIAGNVDGRYKMAAATSWPVTRHG